MRRLGTPDDFGVAVDEYVADELQQARGTVTPRAEGEELGRVVHEAGGVDAGPEARVRDQRLQERQVGLDAPDPELAKRAVHPADCLVVRRRPCGHLLEQRVVERGDDRRGVGRAAVQADAEAGRLAVGADTSVVGDEVVFGVLGGDPALHRRAVEPHTLLDGDTTFGAPDLGALRQPNLCLDDVDPGHDLGHRVLDLDARVDLDKEELAAVGVEQELDGPGALIPRLARKPHCRFAHRVPNAGIEPRRRRDLDDLLVAALHGAVALKQVYDVAVVVRQDLHFDVPGPLDEALEEDLVVAEGRARLAPTGLDRLVEVGRVVHHPHPPASAAPARLDHERESELLAQPPDLCGVGRKRARGGHDRDPGALRQGACLDLVAELLHDALGRPYPGDALAHAGIGQLGVFGEEAVAGVDRVDPGGACGPHDLFDPQVGTHRLGAAPHLVGLVGFEAVQRETVLERVDRHGPQTELGRRPEDPDGDLAPVGHH